MKTYRKGQFLPGRIVPQSIKDKIRDALTGRKLPQSTVDKMRKALKGKSRPPFSDKWRENLSKSHMGKLLGTKNPKWNGMDTNYYDIHKWVNKHWGRQSRCDSCKTTTANRFEWANLDGKYDRLKRNSWARLCRSCHTKYDRYGYSLSLKSGEFIKTKHKSWL